MLVEDCVNRAIHARQTLRQSSSAVEKAASRLERLVEVDTVSRLICSMVAAQAPVGLG